MSYNLTLKTMTVAALAASVAACSTGGGGGGGLAGGGGGGGAGGGGGGNPPGAAVAFAETPATGVTRKIGFWAPFNNPTTTEYAVGDRTEKGGKQFVITVGKDANGRGAQAEYQTSPNKNEPLESGDLHMGGQNLAWSSNKTGDNNGEVTSYYGSNADQPQSYSMGQVDTLSVVDYEYARTGVSNFVDGGDMETYYTFYYGGKDSTITPTQPNASATYKGPAGAALIASEGIAAAEGDFTLNADVSGGGATVSGMIDNIKVTDQGNNTYDADYQISLKSTAVTNGEYSGQAELQDLNGTAVGDFSSNVQVGVDGRSDYMGGFYGPNAEETAGVLDMTGRADLGNGTERVDIVGGFQGNKQPTP